MIEANQQIAVAVRHCRQLSATGYELRLERGRFQFRAGELISLSLPDQPDESRDYTVCSGEADAWIDVLFRVIPDGVLTPRLAGLRAGDAVQVAGPYGTFTLRHPSRPVVFIATGTGLAPCRAYLRTYPDLDLTVLHGVAVTEDLFYRDEFSRAAYYPCVSREAGTGYPGRVGDQLKALNLSPDADYYLCGANEMIYEVTDLLTARGVSAQRIFHEPYYYRTEA